MNYRDLEAVRQIVNNATGLDITYAYEDLVFPENGAFIIQFDAENNNKLYCYFHEDCIPVEQKSILANLANECAQKQCSIKQQGAFTLAQDGENIQIKFL